MAQHQVMLDLETLGTRPGCAILAIGAVHFGTGPDFPAATRETFYTVINTQSCTKRYGLKVCPKTEQWWRGQSDGARKVLEEARACKVGLREALVNFDAWLNSIGGNKNSLRIWGNGADFDNPIITACYDVCDMEPPWQFWNNRCFRSLRNLPGLPVRRKKVAAHHALQDAVDQASEAVEILKTISFGKQATLL